MHILPNIPQGVECLKAFRLYTEEGKRTQLNEAVAVAGSELRLSQAWCNFEVDGNDIHRKLLGIDPSQPHLYTELTNTLEEQVCGVSQETDFGLAYNAGGFSMTAWYDCSMYADSPHGDGVAHRLQANNYKVRDFIRSAELKPGDEFITKSKLVIGFITHREVPKAVRVKYKRTTAWLVPVEVPVCFIPGCLMKCNREDAGELSDSAMQQFLLQQQKQLGLKGSLNLIIAIVGTVGDPSIARETKIFTQEYFEFLTQQNNRRELWASTEPYLDSVEDLHHGEVPVMAGNF